MYESESESDTDSESGEYQEIDPLNFVQNIYENDQILHHLFDDDIDQPNDFAGFDCPNAEDEWKWRTENFNPVRKRVFRGEQKANICNCY